MKVRSMIILVPSVLLLAGCQDHDDSQAGAPALPTATVRVQLVEAKKQLTSEEAVGTVRAKLQARLEAKVAGRIEQMRAVPGQPVQAGELLVRLDAQEIRARLDQALATQQQAASDLKRHTALLERAAATRAEFDAAQARARVAEAAVKEAQTMLSYAEVVAPFDGVVTRKLADVGDLATPGKPLLEMEDQAHLRLEAEIPEALIDGVKLGATLPIRLPNVPDTLRGTVSEVAPVADPSSRTFLAKIDLPTAAGVRAGVFGRVAIPLAEVAALRVPRSAVVQRGQLELAFTEVNGQAQMRIIKTGKQIGDEVEVIAGLELGERVVVAGASQLRDGQPLEVK